MKVLRTALVAMAINASGASPSFAQGGHGASMSDMDMKNMGPLQKASIEAMDKMNKAMMQGMMDPDPNLAWMKGMAAHHQGGRHVRGRYQALEGRDDREGSPQDEGGEREEPARDPG